MSLFVKKFGKYLRRSFNPSTSFNNYNKSDKVSSELKCCNCDRPVHFVADCNRPKRDDRNKRDDRRADDRYRKEERYRRDEEDNERTVDRSKDKSKDKFKERSNDRRMKTSSNKRLSRKHDRKVLVAEESTKSWADSDSDSSSNSSSSSESEQEEVHYFMADQTDDDEGESSSRGPQQPSDVQIRDSAVSGSAGRTPSFAQRIEIAQRRIVETVLDADRNVEYLERQAAAERDRERRRREARLLKRRRS
ncbi:hypothetical protein F511_37209 [Dorcoceras hygrometricum]|uniref:CCHC-type domain-containing protein n=1 Tax=Dorcoceras hygrometricum TaxID=472368 RepID=A0A2Z7C5C7_9LAMI|nr:hypothetical protein F511_37209 [Dorcoceras hygrometricum]